MMTQDDNDQLRVTFPHSDDKIILGPFKRSLYVTSHEFHLEEYLHSALLSRSDLELEFKCYCSGDEKNYWWPYELNVNVNKAPMINPKVVSHRPLHLKRVCRLGRNVIQITGRPYIPPGDFVLRLVHRFSVRSVIDILLKKRLPPSACVTKLKQYFATLGDEETNLNVSLKCPISKRKITVPARGDDCDHIQCFDLESFIKCSAEEGITTCPICGEFSALALLEVDQYMCGILTSSESTSIENIVIYRNAQWRGVTETGEIVNYPNGDNNELPFQAGIPGKEENRIKSAASDALKYGEKKNNRISLLFIGQDRVGKTSLKKTLLGEETQQYQESTIGIDYEVIEVNESDKSKPWKRSEDAQFIASEKYANDVIAREAARKIHEPRRGSEIHADGNRGVHGVGDRKRESGSEGENEEDESEGHGEVEVEDEARRGASNEDDHHSEEDGGGKGDERESNIQRSTEDQYEYPISKELIKKAQKKVENYRDDAFDTIRFMVGDVAGQSVSYDVHSLMLRLRTIFIHVVDLTKDLNAEAEPKFMEKGEKKEKELGNPMRETNLDYLTRWTGALYNLNPSNKLSKVNPAESLYRPKTIIAFTKSDQLSDETEVKLKRDQAMDALDKRFRHTGYNPLIIGNYVTRNTEPRNAVETREIESIREKIFETAQDLLKEQEKTPVNWLVLERLLANKRLEATKRDCPYITLDEAKELGQQCKVQDTSFNEAMEFFHEENIVVHFQGNPPLSELVVLDPAWLVKLFTAVIGVSRSTSCPLIQLGAWSDLQQGKLDFDKLPTALDKHRGSREALKEMMVRARLICRWRGNVYLVPSMVNKGFEEKRIDKLLSECLKPTLFLDFADKSIPLGFYTRFLVELIKWANGHLECESDELQLFCNLMRLVKTENGLTYSVFVVRHISRIEFAILVPDKTIEWTGIALRVLSALDGIVRNIQSTHPSFKGMRYKFGLKCDLCCDETNESCERHNVKACSHGDCVHIWDLKSLKKPLHQCKNNTLALDISKLHESTWVKATGNESKRRLDPEDEQGSEQRKKVCSSEDTGGRSTRRATAEGTLETRKNSCDPPDISVAILELKDLKPPFISLDFVKLPVDVLLLVVQDDALLTSYFFLSNAFKSCITDLGVVYFGVTGDRQNKVKISLVRCGKGSIQVDAAHNVARTAIKILKPKAVFSVGCCGGLNRAKAKLGDVVISAKLSTFGDRKVINDQRQSDGRTLDVSRKFGFLIKSAADGWKAPLKNPDAQNVIVHRDAEILTGVEVVNSSQECKHLRFQFPDAIAIEQEGQGVYSASFDRQLEWVIIKGISHYVDGGEPDAKWRRFSCVMATSVVFNILKQPDVLKGWSNYQETG